MDAIAIIAGFQVRMWRVEDLRALHTDDGPRSYFELVRTAGTHSRSGLSPRTSPRFYTRWAEDSRSVYYSGLTVEGSYPICIVPAAGGPTREVAHSEGPTYENFRFVFNVRGNMLYFLIADRQSDIWMAELVRK